MIICSPVWALAYAERAFGCRMVPAEWCLIGVSNAVLDSKLLQQDAFT